MSNIQKQVTDISTIIEALLFISSEPILQTQLAMVLKASSEEIEKGVYNLETNLLSRGLRITRHGGRIQLTTAPEMGEYIEEFLGLEATSRLSHAALETLAIILIVLWLLGLVSSYTMGGFIHVLLVVAVVVIVIRVLQGRSPLG